MSKKFKIPKFANKAEEIAFIVDNKGTLSSLKRQSVKRAEGISFSPNVTKLKSVNKTAGSTKSKGLNVKAVINTTNVLDSHGDVHMPGIWNKSLKENKRIMMLQEHESKFDKIIASGEDLDVRVEKMSWKALGFDMTGKTQALIFDANVLKSRNPFMYKQYNNERVDNHSVGMSYVKMELAVNDKEYEAEYKVWKDNIDKVVNVKDAKAKGYMWIIKEAKIIEGSAVVNGSNSMTPTISVSSKAVKKAIKKAKNKIEAKELLKAIKNM